MFRVPDLRNKILFTLLMLALYRLGSHVPVPGINLSAVKQLQDEAKNGGVLSFLQLFSGGALTQFAVFALGIMPYITSSIIMQILTVVIPKLEQWQEQGAVGQRKITQWTRYLTIAIALVQSFGLSYLFHNGGGGFGRVRNTTGIDLFGGNQNFTLPRISLVVLTLVAGTALLMWMGELITQRGIGNGMSLLIFASVVSTMPASGGQINAEKGLSWLMILIGVGIVIMIAIVFVEQGQRRIPVQFAKRVVGRRMYGGQSTYIPLKVNQSGVIPIIFASSVLYFPALITGILPWTGVQTWVQNNFVAQNSVFHIVSYALLIIFFAYFYTAIAFNPQQQADIIRKQGGFIPGIRPGPPTERYLQQVLNRITLPGSIFLMVIAVIPLLVFAAWNIRQFPFGGTAILITVGVALETMKQIDSQLMMRNYEGFLR